MISIIKRGFGSKLLDNDEFYITFISDAIKLADPDAIVTLDKFPEEIKCSVRPSDEGYKKHIITCLLDSHRLFNIKIIFSKSLAISNSVAFSVETKEIVGK